MSERIESAAKTFLGFTPEDRADDLEREINAACRSKAREIIAAADAVMFSDESIERAAEALYDLRRKDPKTGRLHLLKPWALLDTEMKPFYRADVRTVIAALREDS